MAKASHDVEPDYCAEMVMRENLLIDAMLGCAFVLCQTQVTVIAMGVVAAAKRGLQINGAGDRKSVLNLGGRASQKIVANIELAANYFKHHEEWMDERQGAGANNKRLWIKTDGFKKDGNPKDVPGRKATIEPAENAGLSPGDDQNVKRLATLLGIYESDDYEGLSSLAEQLKIWQEELLEIVRDAPEKPKDGKTMPSSTASGLCDS